MCDFVSLVFSMKVDGHGWWDGMVWYAWKRIFERGDLDSCWKVYGILGNSCCCSLDEDCMVDTGVDREFVWSYMGWWDWFYNE